MTQENNIIQKIFIEGTKWKSIESLLYYGIITIHQTLLYYLIDQSLYGTIGALFASIYLCVAIVNCSFEYIIPYCFSKINKSQTMLKDFFLQYGLIYCMHVISLTIIIFAILHIITEKNNHTFLSSKFIVYAKQHYYIIGLIIIVESFKKTIRSFLHTALFYKQTAIIESIAIASYVIVIWFYLIFTSVEKSPLVFLQPFLIIEMITLICLLFFVKIYYLRLLIIAPPSLDNTLHKLNFYKMQFFLYGNILIRTFFSSNFLISFSAATAGMVTARYYYYAYIISNAIHYFAYTIVGTVSSSIFAHMQNKNKNIKAISFQYLTKINAFIIIISIINIIFFNIYALSNKSILSNALSILCITQCSDSIIVIYEKFLIVEGKAHIIFFTNIYACIGIILLCVYPFSMFFFISLILIRLITYSILYYASKHQIEKHINLDNI